MYSLILLILLRKRNKLKKPAPKKIDVFLWLLWKIPYDTIMVCFLGLEIKAKE